MLSGDLGRSVILGSISGGESLRYRIRRW